MIRRILTWPEAAVKLHAKSVPVATSEFGTDGLCTLVTDMWDTLYDAGGIGLAAIQIGVKKRVFVMDSGRAGRRWVFINPVIIGHKGRSAEQNEGCLSLPGVVETVFRHPTIVAGGLDENGQLFEHEFHGLEAQCVQHEVEHLDGIIMTDKMIPLKRARVAKQLKASKKVQP